jgi:hypothetical protein
VCIIILFYLQLVKSIASWHIVILFIAYNNYLQLYKEVRFVLCSVLFFCTKTTIASWTHVALPMFLHWERSKILSCDDSRCLFASMIHFHILLSTHILWCWLTSILILSAAIKYGQLGHVCGNKDLVSGSREGWSSFVCCYLSVLFSLLLKPPLFDLKSRSKCWRRGVRPLVLT